LFRIPALSSCGLSPFMVRLDDAGILHPAS